MRSNNQHPSDHGPAPLEFQHIRKVGTAPPNPPPGNFNENRLYFTKSWVNDQSSCSRKEAYRTPSPLIQTLLSVFIITRETVKWGRAQHGFMQLIADVLNSEVMNHPVKLHTHIHSHLETDEESITLLWIFTDRNSGHLCIWGRIKNQQRKTQKVVFVWLCTQTPQLVSSFIHPLLILCILSVSFNYELCGSGLQNQFSLWKNTREQLLVLNLEYELEWSLSMCE